MNKTRGRPRGGASARSRILEVARTRFLRDGYQATTLRAVAADVGVDAAAVSYHFGSKHGLFGAAMALRRNPSGELAEALAGDPAGLVDRVLSAVVDLWEDPALRGPLVALELAALADEDVLRVFGEFMEREVVARFAEFLGGPRATERAVAAAAVIGGLVTARYLYRLPSATALSTVEIRRAFGPPLAAALSGSRTGSRRPAGGSPRTASRSG
ncbi:TetR family transcriptional regulator [Pseudonocardia sp. WMMC193]|uniref:TetR/AcrR family transcriptional regulator n=1 Tax=Pseudonocardia sp. WMMC193 TaxID=2911965 RepID=UPI001F35E191|nr:TetR family transcriptional regulator [Pseudonocardia sp. WMMC193]MCF7547864.1 TetR/AcrR family transcriptional regulator [Pseudonocardia sp. WMMC193]